MEPSVEALTLPLGERRPFAVRFTNPSPEPMLLTDLELVGDGTFELVGGVAPQPIAGGSCTDPGVYELPMVFAPKVLGGRVAQLQGKVGDDRFVLTLRGTGLGARFEVSSPVSYGVVALGESMTRSLVLRNTGTTDTRASVEVVRVLPGNADTRADELCLGQWNGTTCETPRVVVERQLELPVLLRVTTPGAREWVVTLRSSEFGQPVKEVRLSAFFIDTRGCHLVPSTPVVEFDLPMEFKSLRLENRGTADCLVESFALTNAVFRFSMQPPLRRRLTPGQVHDLSLTGLVRSVDEPLEGELTATLLGGMPPPLKVPLRFRASPVAGCLRFPTPTLEFGSWVEGCPVGAREFQARNECSFPVLVQGARATGGYDVGMDLSRGIVAPNSTVPVRVQARRGAMPGEVLGTAELRGVGGVVEATIRGQASARTAVTESFQLPLAQAVDLLFVLDDSPSFAVHQARTESALANFARRAAIDFVDFRVGVTSATRTPQAGRLRALPNGQRWASWRTPSFQADLVALAAVRDGGSEDESCLEAAVRARTAPLTEDAQGTQGFWRLGASQAVVCVSDADDGAPDLDGGIARLGETADGGAFWYGAVTGQPTSQCAVEAVATRTAGLSRLFGGVQDDVCNPGWWSSFFGLTGPASPQTSFWLNATPDLAATQPVVRIDGAVLPPRAADGGVLWSLEPGNLLRLDRSVVDGLARTLSVTYLPTCQ
ncbi:MAG: hypothetical protein SFW67_11205 [Myxococcaceae bacterium]|nr:hypothetical protein [Myxococcaceae bacterium]